MLHCACSCGSGLGEGEGAAPEQGVFDLGPELPELLPYTSRKLTVIQDADGVVIVGMRQRDLDSTAVWMLWISLGHFAFLDVLPKLPEGRSGLLNRIWDRPAWGGRPCHGRCFETDPTHSDNTRALLHHDSHGPA